MAKDNFTIGSRIRIIFGEPYYDYHETDKIKDRKPEIVGKKGTILDMHPTKGYKVLVDTPLPLTGVTHWLRRNYIRRLSFFETIVDWIQN